MNMNLAGLKAFVSDLLPPPVATRSENPWGNDDFVNFLNEKRERADADEFAPRKPEHAASRDNHDDRTAAWRERDEHAALREQHENARADRGHSNEQREDDHRPEPVAQDDAGDSAKETSADDQQSAAQTDGEESESEDAAQEQAAPVDDDAEAETDNSEAGEQAPAVDGDDANQTPSEMVSVSEPILDPDAGVVAAAPVEDLDPADDPLVEDGETEQPDAPIVSVGEEIPVLETPVLETPVTATTNNGTPENAETATATQSTENTSEDNADAEDTAVETNYPAFRGLGLLRAGEVAQSEMLPELFVMPEGMEEGVGIQEVISQFTNRMKGGVSQQAVQARATQGVNITNMAAANAAGGNPGNSGGSAANSGGGSGAMANSMTPSSLPSVTPTSLPGVLPLSSDASFASQLPQDAANGGPNGSGAVNNTHSAANAANAARAAAPQTSAGIQVAIHLARAVQEGLDRINIRLNPAELGRVDVKLEVRLDGTTMAIVAADRQETLDLLQRDARGLERALQEAGMKTDSGSMSFNLRQNGQNGAEHTGNGSSGGRGSDEADASGTEIAEHELPLVDPDRLLDIVV